jgi:hypothetical protein
LPNGGAPPEYTHTAATVWSESLSSLNVADPGAADLLRLCTTSLRTIFRGGSCRRARQFCLNR